MPAVHAQPLICVHDVDAAADWYGAVLGVTNTHAGSEYARLMDGDALVLQLHALDEAHHHGALADPAHPLGNGVAVWFGVTDLDAAVERARAAGATVQTDVHRNPNSGALELWLRDPDGYLVVLAEWPAG